MITFRSVCIQIFFIGSLLLPTIGTLEAQNPMEDPNAIFSTEKGYILEKEKAAALLESELFYLIRKKDSLGNHRYVFKRYKTVAKSAADSLFLEKSTGVAFPEFRFKALDLTNSSLEKLKGKPTVINFWFSTCKPCLQEIPLLNKLVGKYGNTVNFEAFTFESFDKVNTFLKTTQFDYNIIPNAQPLATELGISSYPVHFVLDKNGVIRKFYFGGSNIIDLELTFEIDALLAQKPE